MPPLTRDFRETTMARARRDAAYRAALLTEAADALLQGEAELVKGILRDFVNATLGFDALAQATGLPAKSLHRMLGRAGNPTLTNLGAILKALQSHEGLVLHAEAATCRKGRASQGKRNIGREILEGVEEAKAWRREEVDLRTQNTTCSVEKVETPLHVRGETMAGKNDRFVVRHPEGWAVKRGGRTTPESVHPTQRQAERQAKETVRGLGGGEVRIQDREGRWRDSDTVPPAPDPFPPRDRKR